MESAFSILVDEPTATITLATGENRIDGAAIDAWNDALDAVEADTSVSSLVVVGAGKYWSTGLDLDAYQALDESQRRSFMRRFDLLLGRLLTAPLVTIAAVNGHAYAGGALLALAFDYRIMRDDKGFFCLPSVDVGIPFSPGMSALVAAKLPQPIAHDLVVSGRRVGGSEAAATGIVHRAVGTDAVLPAARRLATAYAGKDRITLGTVKRRMYPDAVEMLTPEG